MANIKELTAEEINELSTRYPKLKLLIKICKTSGIDYDFETGEVTKVEV